MSAETHYAVLGLVPTAAPEVIRAAYKALALICHPDKTLRLSAEERSTRSAAFSEIQAAYDVLGNPPLKAAYDTELACQDNQRNAKRSNIHPQSSSRTASRVASKPNHRTTVKLTTPEEKVAMRAKAHQSLETLLQRRAERDAEEANIDTAGLNHMAQIWEQLAEDNKTDPAMHAHCAIRIHEYEQKMLNREQQRKEWLAKMSTAKVEPSLPTVEQVRTTRDAPQERASSYTSRLPTHTTNISRPRFAHSTTADTARRHATRDAARAEGRNHADAKRTAETATRVQDRVTEKAKREAYKQAQMDLKATMVRAEKAKQKAKVELQTKQTTERIAKARAKAGAAVRGEYNNDVPSSTAAVNRVFSSEAQATSKKICGKCDVAHTSFREWRKCNALADPVN